MRLKCPWCGQLLRRHDEVYYCSANCKKQAGAYKAHVLKYQGMRTGVSKEDTSMPYKVHVLPELVL